MESRDRTIAVDFDGVIHDYKNGFQDGSIYGEPVEGAIKGIKKLQEEGYTIVVFTARNNDNLWLVEAWLGEVCGLGNIKVTNKKIPALAYIDDRGIRFTNWQDVVKYFC